MSFTQQTNQGVVFHTADAFSAAGGIAHGFATRIGGVSKPPFDQLNLGMTRRDDPQDVLENYRRFCAALGTDVEHLVMTHQVHQDTILEAKPEHVLEALLEPIGYDTDGLMTDIPGLCLTIYYADCIPVLLYDPVKRAIAAVHSGAVPAWASRPRPCRSWPPGTAVTRVTFWWPSAPASGHAASRPTTMCPRPWPSGWARACSPSASLCPTASFLWI